MAAFIPSLIGLGGGLLSTIMGGIQRKHASAGIGGPRRAAQMGVRRATARATQAASGAAGHANPNLARRNAQVAGAQQMAGAAQQDAQQEDRERLMLAEIKRQNANKLQQDILGLVGGVAGMGASLASTAGPQKAPGPAGVAEGLSSGKGALGAPTKPGLSAPALSSILNINAPGHAQLEQGVGAAQLPFPTANTQDPNALLRQQGALPGGALPVASGPLTPEEEERRRRMRYGLPPDGIPLSPQGF